MNKIKVLRIIARLNIGGPAIHAVLLTEGLDKTRFETLLVSGQVGPKEGDMSYYTRQKNVRPQFIPGLKRELNLFDDLKALSKIYNIIKIEQPDIVHTHTAKAGTIGRCAVILYNLFHPRRIKEVKLVHTFHGHVFRGYFNRIKAAFFIFIERSLARFTHRIIAVSESVKSELTGLGICKEDKIEVINLGFELGKFLDIPFRQSDILNVGIVGRLTPIKNHRLFLEAAYIILKDNPSLKVKFKVIGDGELKKDLLQYSEKLGIAQSVDFRGWQRDLAEVYTDLDIVALTSVNEGTPVSLIEAMASARAVVATDVGGVKDLLGQQERGIITRPQDPEAFSEGLLLLARDARLRENLGVSARDFVRERFAKERLIKDMENLYKNLIAASSKNSVISASNVV